MSIDVPRRRVKSIAAKKPLDMLDRTKLIQTVRNACDALKKQNSYVGGCFHPHFC